MFTNIRVGAVELPNRVVMAPMTRAKAGEGDIPTPDNAKYYRQRATAGLIITEGTDPSPEGKGYPLTPGIYSKEQIEGWRGVVEAVHEEGGRMAMQIMHCGRIGHPDSKPSGAAIVAPSAVAAEGEIFTPNGKQPFPTPHALETDEIARVIADIKQATANAFEAGCDLVELHGANGYLPHQFLGSNTNLRADGYGGSVENRIRFMCEVLAAMAEVAGAERVGVRLSPSNPFNSMREDDPEAVYPVLLKRLDAMGLAYVHMERMMDGPQDNLALARQHFSGTLIINNEYTGEEGQAALERGDGDLVAYGRYYIANPDLVERFRSGAELNKVNYKALYGAGSQGYTDYPTLAEQSPQDFNAQE